MVFHPIAAAHFASTQLQSRFPTLGEDTKKLIATHLGVTAPDTKSNSNLEQRSAAPFLRKKFGWTTSEGSSSLDTFSSYHHHTSDAKLLSRRWQRSAQQMKPYSPRLSSSIL